MNCFIAALKHFEELNVYCMNGWRYLYLKESNILCMTETMHI